jgi:signal transduction histidine kinase
VTDHDWSHERARSDKALEIRDKFMGSVSHDLRNLLYAMVGISSLIEKEVAHENHVERVVAHGAGCNDPVLGCVDSLETSLTWRALKRGRSQCLRILHVDRAVT